MIYSSKISLLSQLIQNKEKIAPVPFRFALPGTLRKNSSENQ